MIEPLTIPPDEDDRELLRELIFNAEAWGRPDRVYPQVRDALYESWALVDGLREQIDALRAAQGAQEQEEH